MVKNKSRFRKIIVDSSYLLDWLLEENLSPNVRSFQEIYSKDASLVFAPDLIHYEVINSLRNAVLSKRLTPEKSLVAFQTYKFIDLITVPASFILQKKALTIALENSCTSYDATYIALALHHKAELYTLDKNMEKIWKKLRPA